MQLPFETVQEDVIVSDIKLGSRQWWIRLVAAPLWRNLDFIRCTSVIGLMETDCRLDGEHSEEEFQICSYNNNLQAVHVRSVDQTQSFIPGHVSPDPQPL